VGLSDLVQGVDVNGAKVDCAGGDAVELALQDGGGQIRAVPAVGGEAHTFGKVADRVEIAHSTTAFIVFSILNSITCGR
jgi:hypothetical protein